MIQHHARPPNRAIFILLRNKESLAPHASGERERAPRTYILYAFRMQPAVGQIRPQRCTATYSNVYTHLSARAETDSFSLLSLGTAAAPFRRSFFGRRTISRRFACAAAARLECHGRRPVKRDGKNGRGILAFAQWFCLVYLRCYFFFFFCLVVSDRECVWNERVCGDRCGASLVYGL